jgi:PAS domain S-box-containing protein
MSEDRLDDESLEALRIARFSLDHAAVEIYWIRPDASLAYVNEAVCRALGYSRDELLRMTVFDIDPDFTPEQWPAHWERLKHRGTACFETRHRARDGRLIPVEIVANHLEYSGRELHCVVAHDITERKRAEEDRRRLEARVLHAQKLESLGLLAGGIAHDFNNLLVGILGNAGLALMEAPPESPIWKHLKRLETAALRAADLTNQMLAYAGKARVVTEQMDLSQLVQEMVELLQVSVSRKARLRCDLAPGLPPVEGDATQLRQVVMNLITNASDAVGESGGEIRIATGVVEVDDGYLHRAALPEPVAHGPHVFVEVGDNGCGMDAGTLGRIFDPFFSTKFSGRGLGLASVLGIVRSHRGAIQVESEPGRGSTFRVLLPAAGSAVAERPAPEAKADAKGSGGGIVLVVDDEASVRQVAQVVLERGGFEVLAAEDGRRGLEVFRGRAAEIAAVLLDMTMPDMSGDQVMAEMQVIRPDVRVILTSGFSRQDTMERFGASGLAGFIQKPYRPEDLLGKVREVLGG